MKSNIIFRIAMIILCMVLMSGYMVSGILAKYTVGASQGSSARAAALAVDVHWGVEAGADAHQTEGELRLSEQDPTQNTAEFPFTVESRSEIPVNYYLEVLLSAELPEEVTFKIVALNGSEKTEIAPQSDSQADGAGAVYRYQADGFSFGAEDGSVRAKNFALILNADPELMEQVMQLIDVRVCFAQEGTS